MASSYGPGDRSYATQQTRANISSAPYDSYTPYDPYSNPNATTDPYMSRGPQQQNQPYSHQNYPPQHNELNPSYMSFDAQTLHGSYVSKTNDDVAVDVVPRISRTPSPTPSESDILSRKGLIDWKTVGHWRFWFRREWLWYYVILIVVIVLVALIAFYDKQIVHFLQPAAQKIHNLPAGWVIPVAIFFVISFPPLFGHEILAILVGLIWGLWIGFAITALGTLLGEIGNFYAFKYCCSARGRKLEKTKIHYACLAQIIREGGFKVALVARLSAIPGHFTTAIFATCGMNIFVFILAATLSLPKQFITVYIGVILEQDGTSSSQSKKHKIISDTVFAVTALITVAAMWYLLVKMEKVKEKVIYERRKARQGKLDRAGSYPYAAGSAAESSTFNARESESDSHLPLNPGETSRYQQWDASGRAVGYAGDPRAASVHAPSPVRPVRSPANDGDIRDTGLDAPPNRAQLYQQRQDSVDSVGWESSNQGMGPGAYRLPVRNSPSPAVPPLAPPPASSVPGVPFGASSGSGHNSSSNSRTQTPTQYKSFAPPPGPPPLDPFATDDEDEGQAYIGAHVQEPSTVSSTYYTASNPHSRAATTASDTYISPTSQPPPIQRFTSPPPSYREPPR